LSNSARTILSAGLLGAVLCLRSTFALAGTPPASSVTVDAARPTGALPFLFRAGVFLNEYPLDGTFDTFFAELKPGTVELLPLRDGWEITNLREYAERLPSFPSTRWAVETRRRGGRVLIGLTEVPLWLRQSRAQDAYLRPPRDFALWADYVEATVRVFNNQLHLDAEYVLWDEPDAKQFWKGATVQDYFKLYRAFVLGARRADPKARVGGPAVSWWGAPGEGSDGKNPMLLNFIRYAGETPLPELGYPRLPIDFVVWHQFNTDSKGDPLLYSTPVERVRGWLKSFGYDPSIPLSNGSWNSWVNFGKDPNELSPERDTAYEAAYVVQALDAMGRAGLEEQTFFNLFERWQWNSLAPARREREFKDQVYFGGFGLFTKEGLIKPAFNAFKAFSLLEGERLVSVSDDPYLTVIASRSGGTLYVLISNFHWAEEKKMALKGRMLLARGYPLADLAAWAGRVTPQMIEEIEAGRGSIDSLPIPDAAKRELNALSYLEDYFEARNEPKSVRLMIRSLPLSGDRHLERYTIDDRVGGSLRSGTLLKEAALRAKEEAGADVGELLIRWGVFKEESRKWDAPRREREIQALLPRFSKEQRENVEAAVRLAAARALARLNQSPELRLQKVEDRPIPLGARPEAPELTIEMAPYSVHLIVLTWDPSATGKGTGPAGGAR